MPERLRDLLGDLAAVLCGVAVFFAFCGWWVLIPTNIAWLDFADRAMHQLGWMFYRDTPWGLPPGVSPRLGLELSSSIALVDGLPLFALPFKLLDQWLPQPFQYWGYWLLLSFALQGLFAYRLAREFGAGRALALAAAGFVLITPAFLFRVPMHLALSGHWVLLCGLWLYARRTPPALWAWPLLAAITSAIHATLLAMVLALWAAAWLQRLWLRRTSARHLTLEPLLVAAATAAVLWSAGFFGIGSYESYGYGDYKLNLAWPVLRYGWSQIFPDLPHTRFDYEGLSFPGIGILALLLLALLSGAMMRLRGVATRYWLPLAALLVALMLFAFSKNLSFGSTELLKIPVPDLLEKLGSAFRSTGRFVWPLLYVVTIGAVVLVARRFRLAIALPVVLVAFTAQAIDSAPGWRPFAQHMKQPSDVWPTQLVSPFWERAAEAGISRVRAIPVRVMGRDWQALGYYAVTHGMAIDAIYLGRVDGKALADLRRRAAEALATGTFDADTLYTLDVSSALAVMQHLRPGDLLATIDRRIVFVPGGARLIDGLDIENTARNGGSWVPPVAYGGSVPQ